jgi:hypothetical protein
MHGETSSLVKLQDLAAIFIVISYPKLFSPSLLVDLEFGKNRHNAH